MLKLFRIFLISVILPTIPVFAQDKIIAIVNNEAITRKELNDFINFTRMRLTENYDQTKIEEKLDTIKKDLLDRLIEDRLLVQAAKKEGVKVDSMRIKDKISATRRNYATQAEYESALREQGLVEADLETKIREQMLMYALVEAKIKSSVIVQPEEVTDFYHQNIGEFDLPEQREFEYIIFPDEDQAKEGYAKLRQESDWEVAAKKYQYSLSRLTGKKNGELRKEIDYVIFSLNPGEISAPLRIDSSFYIFKLNEIFLSRQQSLVEVQDSINKVLWDKKMQEGMIKFIDGLRKKAYIKIF
ncbi:MAG: peptidyl-prolyl cis-trans isomerase [Candidatus Omnitrophota bacterium]